MNTAPQYKPFRRPSVRLMNLIGGGLTRMGWKRELDVDSVLRQAERRAGLDDFGDRDFLAPLARLIEDFEGCAKLHPLGRMSVDRTLVIHATNRLLLERAWHEQPEFLQVPLTRPIYVIGLPRTGTTLLYNLLCQAPGARPLLFWEALYPAPERSEWRSKSSFVRRSKSWGITTAMNYSAPSLKKIHEIRSDAPEECGWLLNNTFQSLMFTVDGRLPNYVADYWNNTPEQFRDIYNYYRKTLQLLQAGETQRHWVLKSPVHQGTLEPLLDAIPDARVICTHRDPKQVIPSCCSMLATTQSIFSDDIDAGQIGQDVLAQLARSTARAEAARPRLGNRMIDVSYESLVRDPIGTVRDIYRQFQLEMTPDFETRMQTWVANHRQHKFGSHAYSLEQFGLTAEEVDTQFAAYRDRINRLSEPAAA